ncbi:Sensor protein lytS [Fibrisoma limi BUZ 3]|uniref:Sensor protein lytS n=2 Tax=Fibrisoma limi TaxID=663275 RepID=I2GDX9_9BACT|nr:Sensor protein lytS [Fibrisoma limi BUZ 3]
MTVVTNGLQFIRFYPQFIQADTQFIHSIGRMFCRFLLSLIIVSMNVFINRTLFFFSKPEWWYHVLMMPLLFPLGNYYFIGTRYFDDTRVCLVGTAIIFVLYWISIVLLTLVVRSVIRWYPDVRQTLPRTFVMLVLVGLVTALLALFDVWVYSLVPLTGVRFSWETVKPIWALGLVFDVSMCLTLTMLYTYTKWHENQAETEQLKREALQHQFDTLKNQINPHFLFNSLNSLSSLIGEDTERAEQFVDQLAKVYRYLLQSNTRDLVPLRTELDFITAYINLLQTRHGNSLQVEQVVDPAYLESSLPPLSLQVLIDNAIKHNVMLADKPLYISIRTMPGGQLQVVNNVQRKTRRFETHRSGLANLMAKYRLLSTTPIGIEQTEVNFGVTLPLLTVSGVLTS